VLEAGVPAAAAAAAAVAAAAATAAMIFNIDEVTVYFPYPYIYKEQRDYMVELKQALDNKQHCMLEMPTGTGKTITLLSLITSYQLAHPEVPKLVYCTRTVPEMEKALEELRELIKYRESEIGAVGNKILALGLSSRRNMCVHDEISQESDRVTVDAKCRSITASWVRQRKEQDPSIDVCSFYEGFDKHGSQSLLQAGVYTLEDLRVLGREKGWCPYFTARHMIRFANVIVYNYAYVIDPKIKDQVSKEIEKESILVFDEAHNIDNVCIESLSCNINRRALDGASRNLGTLNRSITKAKEEIGTPAAEQLRREYDALLRGVQGAGVALTDGFGGDPVGLEEAVKESMPGDILQAENFVAFMRKVVDFLKERLRDCKTVEMTDNVSFVKALMRKSQVLFVFSLGVLCCGASRPACRLHSARARHVISNERNATRVSLALVLHVARC